MKSPKTVLFSLLVVFIVIVVVQNSRFFMHEEAVRLNLLVWGSETAPIPLCVYFLGFFLIGILLAYFQGLSERFRARREIQNHLQTIDKLEEEIKVLKSLPIEEEKRPPREMEGT